MLTDVAYKRYADQIAKLFCNDAINRIICETSISSRLKSIFTNTGFANFLAKINSGRVYEFNFTNPRIKVLVQNNRPTHRLYVDLNLTDVLTGKFETVTWNWLANENTYKNMTNSLPNWKYNVIQGDPTFTKDNYLEKRIVHKSDADNYGIAFVPSSVPGGVPTGGGYVPGGSGVKPGYTQSGGITIAPAGVTIDPSGKADKGLANIFSGKNTMIILALGLAAFFILKD